MNAKNFLFCVVIFFVSCQNRRVKVYEVPNEVQPYVSSFLAEAGKRGHKLIIDDLIISYEYNLFTSQAQAAGICRKRYGHTPLIFIDTTSINWKTSPETKEQLVFHELCHCILDRGHKSDTLMNGNPVSIMKPTGESSYGLVLNYFKRDYYIDELFNPQIEAPAWSFVSETSSTQHEVIDTLLYENFDRVTELDSLNADTSSLVVDSTYIQKWSLGANSIVRRSVNENRLELESYEKGTFMIPFYVEIPEEQNFEIRFRMMFPDERKGVMTFYWGGKTVKDAFAMIIQSNGLVSMGQIQKGISYTKDKLKLNSEVFNELIIRKVGVSYFFFLNGRLIDNMEFCSLEGNLFGFGVSGDATEVWIDEVLITTLENP